MRDDHEGALRARAGEAVAQVRGEPRDALDVEVVRGLVEEQHVVVGDEEGRERDAATLPAGQRVRRGVEVEVAQQPRVDGADARVRRPGVGRGVAVHEVADRRAGADVVALVEQAHPQAAHAGDTAAVGLLRAREEAQERRLAGPVGADDADAVAVVETEETSSSRVRVPTVSEMPSAPRR